MGIHKFRINDFVIKLGSEGGYEGPGRVVQLFPNWMGQMRYIVAHKIEGGKGFFYHIYGASQLEYDYLATKENEKKEKAKPVITESISESDVNTLLMALGYKPGDLFATRIETKLNTLKGTKYVDRHGQITDGGRLVLEGNASGHAKGGSSTSGKDVRKARRRGKAQEALPAPR